MDKRAACWAVLSFALLWSADVFVHQAGGHVVERFADSTFAGVAATVRQVLRYLAYVLHWLVPAYVVATSSGKRIWLTAFVTALGCGAIAPIAKAVGFAASDLMMRADAESIVAGAAEGAVEGAALVVVFALAIVLVRWVRKRPD